MPHILGLDPSLQKAGYVVLDTGAPDSGTVERGLLKTSPRDGITVQRLIIQSENVASLMSRYDIKFVGMEAPFFGAGSTELLFALNQFLHRVFLDAGAFVVCFPPQQLKKLVFPDVSVANVHKPHMIDGAKKALGLQGKRLAEDVADAYWAGVFGKRFYRWHIEKSLSTEGLGEYERHTFCGKHEYTRGPKKGYTDLTGIVYRENELFFDFEAIKRRAKEGHAKEKAKAKVKGAKGA